jgi:hypothetical protein
MAFEIFTRKVIRTGNPVVGFNALGRISLNQAATAQFRKDAVEFVLLLWDKEAHMVALRPITKRDARAYRVAYNKKANGCGFSAKTFFDYIGLDYKTSFSVPAEWDDEEGCFKVVIPTERLKDERQQRLIPVETPRRSKPA